MRIPKAGFLSHSQYSHLSSLWTYSSSPLHSRTSPAHPQSSRLIVASGRTEDNVFQAVRPSSIPRLVGLPPILRAPDMLGVDRVSWTWEWIRV